LLVVIWNYICDARTYEFQTFTYVQQVTLPFRSSSYNFKNSSSLPWVLHTPPI